jgi:hypothetical protein
LETFKNFYFFILVGCIPLRKVYIALLNIHLQSQLRVFIDVFFSLTTCFGPFGPSSGESQYIIFIFIFSHTSPENGSVEVAIVFWRCVTKYKYKYNILRFT